MDRTRLNQLHTDYLDLIYEGRNKEYGGYKLRKYYPKRLGRAFFLVIGCVALLSGSVALSMSKSNVKTEALSVKQVVLADVPPIDPNKPLPPPPPPPPPPPVRPMVKFTPPVIKPDQDVNEKEVPPPVTDISNSGPKDVIGDPNDLNPDIVVPKPVADVVPPPPPPVFNYVEQMPVAGFDILSYLAKNIKYPDAARENNIDGRVVVKFVVNEDGHVSDVQVVRGIGGGCDEEAVRVVSAMPNWKPGKQNGKAVKVFFTLPIQFKLE